MFNPRSSENQSNEGKGKEKKKKRGEGKEKKKKKAIVALLVFIIVTSDFLAEKKTVGRKQAPGAKGPFGNI